MSRKGNCWDNAPQESFFGHMKDEIHIDKCNSFDELKCEVDNYMNYYNNHRYQWSLAKLSPNQYFKYLETIEYPIKV
jgi:transposase InsO family protein